MRDGGFDIYRLTVPPEFTIGGAPLKSEAAAKSPIGQKSE